MEQYTQTQKTAEVRKKTTLFYHDHPLLGMTIGDGIVRIVQVSHSANKYKAISYGSISFSQKMMADGVLVDPEGIAQSIINSLKSSLTGKLTARRVGMTIPSRRCFIRSMSTPNISSKELRSAIELEVEQYLPVPISDIYLDYNIIRRTESETELLLVAVPKRIVDSYLKLAQLLDWELVFIEPSITACSRLFLKLTKNDAPTILVDFSLDHSDVMILDQSLITANMVMRGSDKNSLEYKEADKSGKEGLPLDIFIPDFNILAQEIKRTLRYYSDKQSSNQHAVNKVVIMGEASNIPGLDMALSDALSLPVHVFTPWNMIDFSIHGKGSKENLHLYTTAAGVALLDTKELFI